MIVFPTKALVLISVIEHKIITNCKLLSNVYKQSELFHGLKNVLYVCVKYVCSSVIKQPQVISFAIVINKKLKTKIKASKDSHSEI